MLIKQVKGNTMSKKGQEKTNDKNKENIEIMTIMKWW